LKGPVTYP